MHAFREANSAADSLATAQLGSDKIFASFSSLPSKTKAALNRDAPSFPFIRGR